MIEYIKFHKFSVGHVVAFLLLLPWLWEQFSLGNGDEVARFGSAMVAIGVLFFGLSSTGSIKLYVLEVMAQTSDSDKRAEAHMRADTILNVLYVFFGTVIWGFGDLFVCRFSPAGSC